MGPVGNRAEAYFGVRGKYNWSYSGNYLSSNPYHIPNDQFLVTINGREFRKYDAATQKILTNINKITDESTIVPGDSRIIGDFSSQSVSPVLISLNPTQEFQIPYHPLSSPKSLHLPEKP